MSQPTYAGVVGALVREFDAVTVDVVEQCVATEARRFADARITVYVPILVEKAARQRIREAYATLR